MSRRKAPGASETASKNQASRLYQRAWDLLRSYSLTRCIAQQVVSETGDKHAIAAVSVISTSRHFLRRKCGDAEAGELGYLKPAGNLQGSEHKYFSTKYILKLGDDEKWVNDATRAVSKYWAGNNDSKSEKSPQTSGHESDPNIAGTKISRHE